MTYNVLSGTLSPLLHYYTILLTEGAWVDPSERGGKSGAYPTVHLFSFSCLFLTLFWRAVSLTNRLYLAGHYRTVIASRRLHVGPVKINRCQSVA